MPLAAGEYWKYTTTALGGALVAGASFFAVGATKWIDRTEAKEMAKEVVKNDSPYIEDRQYILKGLEANSVAIRELTAV